MKALGAAFLLALMCSGLWAASVQNIPPVKLRGYGTLSGSMTSAQVDGQPTSLLTIACESIDKAKLLQAKYLSDLQLLPGVAPTPIQVRGVAQPGFAVENQGAILTARDSTTVYILAAASPKALEQYAEQALPQGNGLAFAPEATVPMYLDRWDKYGFRFYYGPYARPKDANGRDIRTYDVMQDFNFANAQGKCGLVLWSMPLPVESAEGISNLNYWDWALKQAQVMKLPVGINFEFSSRSAWLYNRYPEQMTQHQPQFLGGWYGALNFGEYIASWSSPQAQELQLAQMQKAMRALRGYDNIVNWLEPHCEMGHGCADKLLEYGPQADANYRTYLFNKYRTLAAVSSRWYGDAGKLRKWDDVHVPEVASFLGWGPQAIDLTGPWHVGYAPFKSNPNAPTNPDPTAKPEPEPSCYSPEFDDSAWPTVIAPGHGIALFLPRKPAVYRRHITVDPAWRAAHPQVWLYVWDLNNNQVSKENPQPPVQMYVNGVRTPENLQHNIQEHWGVADVSKVLKDGDNLIVVTLPNGLIDYRAYLSPIEPKRYPELGPQLNAQWVDYADWNSWIRGEAVRRGAQAIRQIDPDRPITFASPDSYLSPIKAACEDYGGVFHNTGYMGGFW
ncbi:MAG TPA: hypothetical protein VGM23_13985, partial [Armatimonadota bacterium]